MSESVDNLKLRLGILIMKAKDSVKETEGLFLRSKVMLRELEDIKAFIDKPEVVITVTTNAECFKDTVVVSLPSGTQKQEKT